MKLINKKKNIWFYYIIYYYLLRKCSFFLIWKNILFYYLKVKRKNKQILILPYNIQILNWHDLRFITIFRIKLINVAIY